MAETPWPLRHRRRNLQATDVERIIGLVETLKTLAHLRQLMVICGISRCRNVFIQRPLSLDEEAHRSVA
jgi:hypothetical protein